VLKHDQSISKVVTMNKAAEISHQEAHYKAQAERYLAGAQRILRKLATERRRDARRRIVRASILEEVKTILNAS
jgi:hypothetical protein